MAIDNRIGKKVAKNLRREEAPATRVDPFPYIGIVKNNLDPSRAGRLQVWIPDLGGDENNPQNWRTVNYASPYAQGNVLINKFQTLGASIVDIAAGKLVASQPIDATEFKDWTEFPAAAQLSKYYNIGALSSGVHDVRYQNSIIEQGGLTRYDIVSNLKNLAVNSLDTITTKYPNVLVSNAFTPTLENMASMATDNNAVAALAQELINTQTTSATLTAHLASANPYNLGQAANLHFSGVTAADYFTIAQWIRDNVNYDQIRLEYTTYGNTEPWISVINKGAGNRTPDIVDKVVTTMNGRVVANYLVDMTSIK